MTENEVVRFAVECLNKVWPGQLQSLSDLGWRFQWCRSKRTLGWCKYGSKTIEVSPYYLNEPEETTKDTILHEIAHALAGPGTCHGPMWKKWCHIVGAKAERCAKGAKSTAVHRWVGKCKCGYEHKMHRRPKYIGGMYHTKCGKVNGVLTWYETPSR